MGEEEKQGSKTVSSSDLSDYTIIKEGEAEILMHAKNEVFYNKTQVFLCLIALSFLVNVENIVFLCGFYWKNMFLVGCCVRIDSWIGFVMFIGLLLSLNFKFNTVFFGLNLISIG